jgi:hypothetical protein
MPPSPLQPDIIPGPSPQDSIVSLLSSGVCIEFSNTAYPFLAETLNWTLRTLLTSRDTEQMVRAAGSLRGRKDAK